MQEFQFVVTLGDAITAGTSVVAVLSVYFKLRERITVVETKVDPMWQRWLREQER